MTVSVVYWSGTGNTRAMAESIAAGAKSAGAKVDLLEVAAADPDSVLRAEAIALGCPAMGAEVLEESEMEPFVQRLESKGLGGKPLLLFGSYDWGDGQWLRDWEAGASLVSHDLKAHLEPGEQDIAALSEAGKKLASSRQ